MKDSLIRLLGILQPLGLLLCTFFWGWKGLELIIVNIIIIIGFGLFPYILVLDKIKKKKSVGR
jgi:hypothetical protein